jgi:hypothetical protein
VYDHIIWKQGKFDLLFSYLCPFFSFYCLIAQAKTLSTTLNKNSECLVPDFRGIVLFFPFQEMLTIGLLCTALLGWSELSKRAVSHLCPTLLWPTTPPYLRVNRPCTKTSETMSHSGSFLLFSCFERYLSQQQKADWHKAVRTRKASGEHPAPPNRTAPSSFSYLPSRGAAKPDCHFLKILFLGHFTDVCWLVTIFFKIVVLGGNTLWHL